MGDGGSVDEVNGGVADDGQAEEGAKDLRKGKMVCLHVLRYGERTGIFSEMIFSGK